MKLAFGWIVVFGVLVWAGWAQAQGGNPELVAQAKKQGKVTWYTTVSIPESQKFAALFREQFPSITVDIVRSGSGALVNRMISEANADQFLVDALQGYSSRGGVAAALRRRARRR